MKPEINNTSIQMAVLEQQAATALADRDQWREMAQGLAKYLESCPPVRPFDTRVELTMFKLLNRFKELNEQIGKNSSYWR